MVHQTPESSENSKEAACWSGRGFPSSALGLSRAQSSRPGGRTVARAFSRLVKIHQRGVQWKQGVVVYIVL